MKSIATRITIIALIIGAAALALTGTADAAHTVATITLPEEAEVGQLTQLQLAVRSADEGLPVADTIVTVYTDASFGGVRGEVELGRAITDETGVAIVDYEPASSGEHQLRIEYLAPGQPEPEVATTTISVVGATQLYQSTSGIQVPGLNVWLIMTLVGGVWFLLFTVGVRVFAIARANDHDEEAVDRGPGIAAAELGNPGA